MSMDKLKIEVLLAAINKATGPLKAIQTGSSETAKALKATKDQLKELNDEQKRIDGFRTAARGIAIHRQELAKAEERVRTISEAMKAAAFPTKEMQKAFKEATGEANRLKGNITQLTEKQERLRRELNASGADTHKLSSYQRDLKGRMATATAEIEKQSKALEELGKRQQRLHAVRAAYDKSIEQRNRMAGAGAATTAAGVAMGMPIVKAVRDYASFEDAMLGVARQVDGAKDANGNYTRTYYEMGDAIKALSEKLPLTSVEFANIVEAAARMGIQGKENLLTFAETAAKSAIAFNLPVDELSEQMGKLAGLYKIPIQDIATLGDTINYLDDNALSKGGDIINVMQRIAGVTASVGMGYKESAALASTFLSMGDSAETAATASSAMIMRLSNAPILATAKRYKAGLDMLGLDAHKLQIAMTKDATGTLQAVMDAINKLPQNKQLEASTRIFGVEYGHEGTKLAQNMQEYRKQLQLVNEEKAKGSMDREAIVRARALSAQYEMSKNAVTNLSSELGESLKPALVDILASIKDVLIEVRAWTKEHPDLTANLVKGAAVIATIVTVVGGLLLAVSAVRGPLALLKLTFAMIGIKGAGAFAMIKTIGSGILWLGRALMMNPIGLAITAIATAAYLIYENWAPIKEFFSNLWDGITEKFNTALEWIKGKLGFLKPLLDLLMSPAKLAAAGMAAVMGTTPAQAVTIDSRPPIMAPAAHGGSTHSFAPTVHIHPAPGMNEQQLGHFVKRTLESMQREQAAKKRSKLTDSE